MFSKLRKPLYRSLFRSIGANKFLKDCLYKNYILSRENENYHININELYK